MKQMTSTKLQLLHSTQRQEIKNPKIHLKLKKKKDTLNNMSNKENAIHPKIPNLKKFPKYKESANKPLNSKTMTTIK
jgi:hypothetical protein